VERQVIALDGTRPFGDREFTWKVAAPAARWARLEVWDIAGDGAFTNPVWFGAP